MPNRADPAESAARRVYVRGATPGERIAYCRRRLGISQRDLGAVIGCTAGAVGHWELGRSRPGETNAQALAEAFGVPRHALRI